MNLHLDTALLTFLVTTFLGLVWRASQLVSELKNTQEKLTTLSDHLDSALHDLSSLPLRVERVEAICETIQYHSKEIGILQSQVGTLIENR